MTDHDRSLVERLRVGVDSGVVEADDPVAVAGALVAAGARSVPPSDVGIWTAEAQELRALADAVLAAEEGVARARSLDRQRGAVLDASAAHDLPSARPERSPHGDGLDGDGLDGDGPEADGPEADRAAVRFALVVLGLAQVGGLAVYLADGLLLAVAAPALAIAGVVAVAMAHRSPAPARTGAVPRTTPSRSRRRNGSGADVSPAVEASGGPEPPGVRAAQAHLRRQQAAWKAAWWQRGLSPGDVGAWVGPSPSGTPTATLVVADPLAEVDDGVVATMAAAVPATVRLVVVRRRPA